VVLTLLVGAALLAPVLPAASGPLAQFYRAYPLERLEPVAGERPSSVRVLPPIGPGHWPRAIRAPLEERIRSQWPLDRAYGPLQSWVRLWLAYPLVTGHDGWQLLVPVVAGTELPIRGVVDLPESRGPRRVVLLVDVSGSANARTLLSTTHEGVERVSVLEAERRALRRLVEVFAAEQVALGVIAYGESARPIARPGTAYAEIRSRLELWERSTPRGEGRTDLLCALELGRDWLRDTPAEMEREIFLLTDGDLPVSGRFFDCTLPARRGGKSARATCEARRNTQPCPATHRFRTRDGFSDPIQLERFARRARSQLRVHPLVFDATRSARLYRELADSTGGTLFRIPSAEALDATLPALALRGVRSVHARNERTGVHTADLLDRTTGRFEGALPLADGPNDVLLTVEGQHGPAALYRFRIYAEPDHLRRSLAELRIENRELAHQLGRLRERSPSAEPVRRSRSLEIRASPGSSPAAPDFVR
jgi:hypothetical protein